MTTKYRVSLDRVACDGIFACLVRDERFRESADGLATIESDGASEESAGEETLTATFTDERLDQARQAAVACPVDAIEVTEVTEGE